MSYGQSYPQPYLNPVCYTFKVNMSKEKFVIIIAVIVLVGALYWYLFIKKGSFSFPLKTSQPTTQPAAQPQTLGGKIYEGAKNPIQNKVPTLSPVANPVQGLYKNPFQ